MNRGIRIVGTSLGLLFVAGCASESYRYIPAQHQASTSKEAIYNEPPEAPNGTVRIRYEGMGDFQASKDAPKEKALHLQLFVSNTAKIGNWGVDPKSFFVAFPNGTRSTLLGSNPVDLVVQPGELKTMDVYFALPPGMQAASNIPNFDFHWQALAVDQQVTVTTAFDRIQEPKYYAYDPYWPEPWYYGYGPYYSPGYSVGLGYGWGRPW